MGLGMIIEADWVTAFALSSFYHRAAAKFTLFRTERKLKTDIKMMLRDKISRLSTLAVFVAVLLCLIVQSDGTDPCVTHGNLSNPFRSTGYVARDGVDPMICDQNLQTGWYRFVNEVGGQMPETKPTKGQCGTYAPIWLKTKHPSTADGIVDRTACINYNDLKDGCLPMGIKVKNCSDSYYVYRLVPTLGCPMAYCAGTCFTCFSKL